MSSTGRAVLDFGPWPGRAQASTIVVGLSTIPETAQAAAWVRANGNTADHTADEHTVERIRVVAGSVVPGVGFTIYAECLNGRAYGRFAVDWVWVNNAQVSVALSQAHTPVWSRPGVVTLSQTVGWNPSLLPGLTAWYRADDVVLNGSTVSQWPDRSGNALHSTQATTGNQPLWVASSLNGQPAVDFDGTNDSMQGPAISNFVTASVSTVFAVVQVDVADSASTDGNSWNNDAIYTDAVGNFGAHVSSAGRLQVFSYSGSNAGVGYPYTVGNGASLIRRHVSNVLYVNVDGNPSASVGAGPLPSLANNLHLGRSAGANYLDGKISELVFCNQDASAYYANWLAYVTARYALMWTPANLAGVTCWLRADDVTLNSGNVSQWNDKSGNANHFTQSNPSFQPVWQASNASFNDQATMQFDGGNDTFSGPAFGNLVSPSGGEVLMVVRYDENVLNDELIVALHSGSEFMLAGFRQSTTTESKACNYTTGSNITPQITMMANTVYKAEWRHDSGILYWKVGATETSIASGDTSANVQSAVTRIAYNGLANWSACTFAEVVFTNTPMSASDRLKWDAYVAARYGI